MNGVVSRSVLTRVGIAVLVAGAHAGGLAWLTKRVVFIASADEGKEVLLVELVPRPVKPLVPLPEVEARARLPEEEAPLPRLVPLPDPVPNPLPETLRTPALPRVELPIPAPAEPSERVLADDKNPFVAVTPEARSVLLALQCERLGGETNDLPCDEAGSDRATVAASLKPLPNALPSESLPVAYSSVIGQPPIERLIARQGPPPKDHPYQLSSLSASPTRAGPHAIPDSAPGSQAMRDMAERAVAQPHPVWGD